MNYIEFFEKQIEKYNEDSKCDFCWFFSAPLTRSAMNIQQLREDSKCCVQVMITRDEGVAFSVRNTYNENTTFQISRNCDKNLVLHFYVPHYLGVNNYNEIVGYSPEESRSAILMRLEQCLSCDLNLDFCEIMGQDYMVMRWDAYQVINENDNNYIGFKIYITLRDKIQ